jgi:RHS repeat-associated protein
MTFVAVFGGCSSLYASDVPLGGISTGITPFSVPYPIQFTTLNWSAGVTNGSAWGGYLVFYTDAMGTNVIATSTTIGLPAYGCNGDCGSLSFPSTVSFAPNTTYYGQFIETFSYVGESPSFTIGLHPSGFGYAANNPPYDTNSVFYDTSDIERIPSTTYGSGGQTSQNGFASEPINTATGNYFTSHADLVVPGKGLAFNFDRFYNSLDPYSGPLGAGWTHSFNVFLAVNGNVTVKEADGHTATFTPTGGGNYRSTTAGVFDTLSQNSDGTYTLVRKNQTRFNFSAVGQLTSVVDRNGNTETLRYDGSGYLISILDSSSRVFTFTNDSTGRITNLSDPTGRTWRYAYDANGNLQSITDAASGLTQYAYDVNHRMTSATDPRGVTYLQNVYDSLGRVISQTNARAFTTTLAYSAPSPGITSFTDPLGNTTQHVYDGSLRLTSIIDAKGGIVSYTYDGNNDRTSVTNQNGKTTALAYDANGNTTAITDPLGNITKFSYDSMNDLLSATSPNGNTTTFSYDAKGNLLTSKDPLGDISVFAFNSTGLLTSTTNARGNTTTFSFDGFGDLTKITDALGYSTNLAYDGIGRIISVTDAKGHTGTSSYDALSRIVNVVDPLGNQTQFAYDPVSNLLKIKDANGHATGYAYDGTNDLSTVTDAAGNVTRYVYDANNNRTGFTNAKGNTTLYGFDQVNRLNQITDALSLVASYQCDAVGNVISVTDADGKTNQFSFDPLNRLTNIAYADGTTVAYSYDPDGNRLTLTDPHGTTAYSYDALDRRTSVTNPGSKIVHYSYDAVGNRSSLTYPDGKIVTYSYDRLNRLASAADWLGKTTNYTYDAVRNLVQTQYPNRAATVFTYDAANRVTEIVNSALGLPLLSLYYALDKVGNRTSLSVDGVPTTFTYDSLNELVSAQLGPLKTTWTYDQVGNRLKQVAPTGTTAYTYDADDRVLSAGATTFVFDHDGNLTSKTNAGATVNYAYDAANRLIHATGPALNSSFAYDGDGNRVTQAVAAGTYSYVNDVNTSLPVVLSEQGPDGAITYAYGQGLIEEYNQAFNYFYQTDGLGSVVALTNAAGMPTAAYAYDPWGNALLTTPDTAGTKNKFRFTGQALDPGTGLYYLRRRYYDPTIGRFIRKDPFAGFASQSTSLNRFVYTLNNPLRFRDASGLSVEPGSTIDIAPQGSLSTPPTSTGVPGVASQVAEYIIENAPDLAPLLVYLGVYTGSSEILDAALALASPEAVGVALLVGGLYEGFVTFLPGALAPIPTAVSQ